MFDLLKSGGLTLLLGLLLSCTPTEKQPNKDPARVDNYFPLSDFVKNQINLLGGKEVSRRLFINGEEEQVKQTMSEENWGRELDLFMQSDINKSSLASSYSTIESDEKITHLLIEGEPGDVEKLEVFKDGDHIERIEFSFKKENTFYLSQGSGTLTINPETGRLSAYRLTGYQKVWFLSANTMELEGEVLD